MNLPMTDTTPSRAPKKESSLPADAAERAHRAGLYSVLAGLLRDAPEQATLDFIAGLNQQQESHEGDLPVALNMLALAARHSQPAALRDEYHALFIGLGRGELVPYGSWYQTGFLMEKPLGLLRADLARLGFERTPDTHEPEDHIAALCEVMAMLITDGTAADQQRQFFGRHLGSWSPDFFTDLGNARAAVFYRSVARLGSAVMAIESHFLSLSD